jgi:Na+/melibiose symporter-like transporter
VKHIWRVLADHRDYRLLLSAGLISATGDWVLRAGLAYAVYAMTGSTIASGALLLSSALPQVLLGSVAGIFIDRWDHRRTMILANLVMAAGLAPLFAVEAGRIWIVYVVAAGQSALASFFTPAEAALVPRLVSEDSLITANALNGQNANVSRLLGPALGGVLAGFGGIPAVAGADAASFVLAALLLMLMRGRLVGVAVDEAHHLWRDWRTGMAAAVTHPVLRVLFTVIAISCVGEGIMGTLFAPFVRGSLHGASSTYGAILSAQAVGGIAGGLLAASLGHRLRPSTVLGWGTVCFGLLDLVLFLYPLVGTPLWPAFTVMVVVGLPGALMSAALMTLFQTATADGERGRVFGAVVAVEGAAMLLGIVLGGWLGEAIGVIPVIAAQGAGYLIAGAFVLATLNRAGDHHNAPGPDALPSGVDCLPASKV